MRTYTTNDEKCTCNETAGHLYCKATKHDEPRYKNVLKEPEPVNRHERRKKEALKRRGLS